MAASLNMEVDFRNGTGSEEIECKTENDTHIPIIDIEILQNSMSSLSASDIEYRTQKFLETIGLLYGNNLFSHFENEDLKQHIKELRICDERTNNLKGILLRDCRAEYHIYKTNGDGPASEELEGEELSAAKHWVLPSTDFHGLWESLIYDSSIKNQLMNFVMTSLLFSDKSVDSNVISWNRVVLLHGPPGTGKTSLCKALAQKISIRLSRRYKYGQLIEINSHSLFSKWFSESGKLVMKMFQKIQELIDESEALVFVLIDEVESLAHARSASMGGGEPSDAIRVVNALLTQLDQIKRYPNVIILTTSNMTEAIDLAFVDRADIKYFIGMPSSQAIYQILLTCLKELLMRGIILPMQTLLSWHQLESHLLINPVIGPSFKLKEIAKSCEGLSGRTLKKLPFLAQALFIQSESSSLETFLDALKNAVERQFKDKEDLRQVTTTKE